MSEITDEDIDHLAKLSRIAVTQEDKAILSKDLKRILNFINLLEKLDTEGVPTCDFVLKNHRQILRDDKIEETLSRDEFLKNTPDHIGGMIKVPPIIRKEP